MPSFDSTPTAGVASPALAAPKGFRIFDDFTEVGTGTTSGSKFATSADAATWLNSTDNGGTTLAVDGFHGGAVRLLPGTAAGDYVSIQMNGRPIVLGSEANIKMATRVRFLEANDKKFFFGLATTTASTSATVAPVLDGVNDTIGFRQLTTTTTSLDAVTEDDTNETTTTGLGTLAALTWVELAIEIDGLTAVRFYINGALVATHTTNIPDSGVSLTPTFEIGSPTGTTSTYLDIDYLLITGDRA